MRKMHYMIIIVLSILLFINSCDDVMKDFNQYSGFSNFESITKSLIGTHIVNGKLVEVLKDNLIIEGKSVKDILLSQDSAGKWKNSITQDLIIFVFTPSKDISANSAGFPQKDLIAGTEYPIVITHDVLGTSIIVKNTEILGDLLINTSGTGSGTGGSGSGTGGSGSGSGGSGSGTGGSGTGTGTGGSGSGSGTGTGTGGSGSGTGGSGSGTGTVVAGPPKTNAELKTLIAKRIKRDGNNADLTDIDVSNITDMSYLFDNSQFNGDISNWDVSNVTDMFSMFSSSSFNGDISKWDVSKVTSMTAMFAISQFNQDISAWDVSNVTDMEYMFDTAAQFNQDLSQWDVSKVTTMAMIFHKTKAMTYNLEAWGSKLRSGVNTYNAWIGSGVGTKPSWA